MATRCPPCANEASDPASGRLRVRPALSQGATADSRPGHHAPLCGETARRRGVEPLTGGSVVQVVIHPSLSARGREAVVQAWETLP
jgi:hypothetical protein